jgi:hypothetical protein
MRRRAVLSSLSAGVAVIALAACGSSATSSSGSLSAGSGGSGASAGNYQARLNFAKCMRSHGVNVPDPSANGGPAAGAGGGGAGGGGGFQSLRDNPNFQSASQACAKYRSKAFGFANITPAERAQFGQEEVKFAECMRSHSVNIADPSNSGTGGGFGAIFREITPAERQSPAFQTAFKDCSASLPFRRRGAGGGAPPGAPGA